GLVYDSYSWSAPYAANSIFDDSKPLLGSLPVTLDEFTLAGPGYPAGVVDVELSNAAAGLFSQGLLATLSLTVPLNYRGGDQLVSVVPDPFAHGFQVIDTTAGAGFQIIVPAPPALALLAMLGCGTARRRRRR